jgi:predicted alpha/beta-hydrolase family hydrolase
VAVGDPERERLAELADLDAAEDVYAGDRRSSGIADAVRLEEVDAQIVALAGARDDRQQREDVAAHELRQTRERLQLAEVATTCGVARAGAGPQRELALDLVFPLLRLFVGEPRSFASIAR